MKLVLLSLVCFVSTVGSASNGYYSRRILHQPLYPIQWTPPPPPPPELSDPSPDTLFFPSTPATPYTDAPIAANVSSAGHPPSPARRHSAFAVRVAVAVSASVVSIALVVLLGLFLLRRRRRAPGSPDSRKLVGGGEGGASRRALPPGQSAASGGGGMGAEFLYVGTMEPGHRESSGGSNDSSSPNRKLGTERVLEMDRQPSPELRPLPPLRGLLTRREVVAPPAPMAAGLSDDDTFYTPQRSLASATSDGSISPVSRRSMPSLPNTISGGKEFLASAVSDSALLHPPLPLPWSRRTSQRMQLFEGSNSEVKQINPPKRQQPSPPPPPPPPPPLSLSSRTDTNSRMPPAPPPPPPPPPPSNMAEIKEQSGRGNKEPMPVGPSSRRRLLKPLPPEVTQLELPFPPIKLGNGVGSSTRTIDEVGENLEGDAKPKLKPLHWDKVRASSDRAMVWDQLKSSSFQLNEDMIEVLFANNTTTPLPKDASSRQEFSMLKKENQVLDPKKSQNIAILLRALNLTIEEVTEALMDGNPEPLGEELLETLVKMSPTKEEELKLRDYAGDSSKLGSAERFLKALLDIPFAFKRVDAMLYRVNFESEVNYIMKSYGTLEAACEDLKSSRLFLKLLEAVLKTGNRLNVGTNRGQAKAFKLDTLLKLADIKGTDGKTTLLHFVVQEIIRSEGSDTQAAPANPSNVPRDEQFKKQELKIVAGLSSELGNVRKAAAMDSDVLSCYLSKLEFGLHKVESFLQLESSCTQGMKFFETMKVFLKEAETEIHNIKAEERRVLNLVKEITEYFHGDAAKEEAHPLRIFVVVRDFLSTLDNVCKEVGRMHERTIVGSARSFSVSYTASLPVIQRYELRRESNSDDDNSAS